MTTLKVEYDRKLRRLCTDEVEMQRKRGDITPRLKLRIKALEAAETVAALRMNDPLGKWHPVESEYPGCWAGKLSTNYRLIVRLDGSNEPADVTGVTVIEIVDYHR